jgi:hypothetical protein
MLGPRPYYKDKGPHRTGRAGRFFNASAKKSPFKISAALTIGDTEFTDMLIDSRQKHRSGGHDLDRLC